MKSSTLKSLPRVILVHGLFMGRHAMLILAKRLRKEGFQVECFAYNTVTGSLDSAASRLAARLSRDASPVALVGHSLGGLVSLYTAKRLSSDRVAAVVMLGSPYQGAEAGRKLRNFTGGSRSVVARALADWAALEDKPVIDVPVYTLGGTKSAGLGRILCRFAEPNDGTVTIKETYYPGATACILPVSHTGMLFDPQVASQVSSWLQTAQP